MISESTIKNLVGLASLSEEYKTKPIIDRLKMLKYLVENGLRIDIAAKYMHITEENEKELDAFLTTH